MADQRFLSQRQLNLSDEQYLDKEHLALSDDGVEYHPLRPFLPQGCRALFLGSFPPPRKRWCVNFYYPNYLNDHWRIEGLVFFGDKDHFVDTQAKTFRLDEIVPFVKQTGIGFYDTAAAVRRLKDNASDKFLEVVVHTDLQALLAQIPMCQAIVTTGEKAAQTLCARLGVNDVPAVGESVPLPMLHDGLRLYRLPSSSRAYPLSIDKKAEAYRRMFHEVMPDKV